MKALILLSGGLDSTTALALALEEGKECVALSFDYGQRHRIELEAAKNLASHYAVPHRIVRIDPGVFSSPLTEKTKAFPKQTDDFSLPVAYVPCRNLLFLSMAAAFAESEGCSEIYFAAHADDASYPDCQPEFFESFQKTLQIGSRGTLELKLPFLFLTKKALVEKAKELSVPIALTWSCYDPQGTLPCGQCLACQIRKNSLLT